MEVNSYTMVLIILVALNECFLSVHFDQKPLVHISI